MTSNRKPPLLRRLLTRILPPLAILALAAFGAHALMTSTPDAGRRPPPERQPRLVEVVRAEPTTQPVEVSAWGEVRAAQEVALTPQVGGRVLSLHPELVPGGFLEAGTVALEIDPRDYELQLRRARSQLTQAQAELALEQGQQAVAKREYELLGRQVSEQEKRLILRAPQLETAQAAVASARAAVAEAELALARAQVETPFDALVLERQIAPGAQVGTSTEVATLAGTDRWWVEVAVPVSALGWIEVPRGNATAGSVVRLRDASWPAGQYREGRVVRRYGAVEQQGRMARLLVEVEDPLALQDTARPSLLIGAFLQARILGRTVDDVYALEPGWLHQDDTVWVMNDENRLEMRPVEIAYRGERQVLVRAGLAPGERIVVSPINAATDGMPLRAAEQDRDDGADRDAA